MLPASLSQHIKPYRLLPAVTHRLRYTTSRMAERESATGKPIATESKEERREEVSMNLEENHPFCLS